MSPGLVDIPKQTGKNTIGSNERESTYPTCDTIDHDYK